MDNQLCNVVLPIGQQEGTESVVSQWLKKVGEGVIQNEPLLEISTDKVVLEIPAPAGGTLLEIRKGANAEVHPGEVLGVIAVGSTPAVGFSELKDLDQRSAEDKNVQHPVANVDQSAQRSNAVSPAVRELLKKYGLEVTQIRGSGTGGRVTASDVENYSALRAKTEVISRAAGQGASDSKLARTGVVLPHSVMRRSIANHMVDSLLHTAPHVTTVFELDLSTVIKHRDTHRAIFEDANCKLTFTAYFVKAAAIALQAVPSVNSRWHDDGLELFEDSHIGIATATTDPKSGSYGLIVPVVHSAQKLSLLQTAQELTRLTKRARDAKLEPREVQGGTFTISNHGVSGSLLATPIIINQPQSAILGIGKLEKRVVVVEQGGKERFEARPKLYVTLSIDHRVLDGFTANQFLSSFVGYLEQGDF